jgi:hypothetical protein
MSAFTRARARRLRHLVIVTVMLIVIIMMVALRDALTLVLKEEVVPRKLLLLIQLALILVDTGTERIWITTERDIEVFEELVAASEKGFRGIRASVN